MMTNTSTRTFEYKDDKSSKFWEVTQAGSSVMLRYGRTGSDGQTQEKMFSDSAAASKHVAKLVAEKSGKGYVEIGSAHAAKFEMDVTSVALAAHAVNITKDPWGTAAKLARCKNPVQEHEVSPESLTKLLDKDGAPDLTRAVAEVLSRIQVQDSDVSGFLAARDEIWSEHLSLPVLITALDWFGSWRTDQGQKIEAKLTNEQKRLLLETGLNDQDHRVRKAIAERPECPPEYLERLLLDKDPSVQLAALKHPAWDSSRKQELLQTLSKQNVIILTNILQNCEDLVEFLGVVAGSKNNAVRSNVALHPCTPVRILEDLAGEKNKYVRANAASNPNTPLQMLEELAKEPHDYVRSAVASNLGASVQILKHLANDIEEHVRRNVAENTSTPVDLMEKLAKDKNKHIRAAVASNRNIPIYLLEKLAVDRDVSVRRIVADKSNAPKHVLEELAKDIDDEVRGNVADNPSTPGQVLEELSREKDEIIRKIIAQNPNTPIRVLDTLSRDESWEVSREVAVNLSTPIQLRVTLAKTESSSRWRCFIANSPYTQVPVLEALAKDRYEDVRRYIAENPNTSGQVLKELANDQDDGVRRNVAGNPSTPFQALEWLAEDADGWIRKKVASNPSAHFSVLEALSKDRDAEVRCGVAGNSKTSSHVLAVLAKDKDENVRKNVAENPNVSQQILEGLTSISAREHEARAMFALNIVKRITLREICKRQGKPVDQLTAVTSEALLRALGWLGYFSPSVDIKSLTKASRSKDWLVRLGLALHPDATEDMLKILEQDADICVARAAQFRQLKAP